MSSGGERRGREGRKSAARGGGGHGLIGRVTSTLAPNEGYAPDLPGVRTLVRHGETGLHVRPGDASSLRAALLTLLKEQELRERFGRMARQHAEGHFAWPPLITRLEQTYERVVVARQRQSER